MHDIDTDNFTTNAASDTLVFSRAKLAALDDVGLSYLGIDEESVTDRLYVKTIRAFYDTHDAPINRPNAKPKNAAYVLELNNPMTRRKAITNRELRAYRVGGCGIDKIYATPAGRRRPKNPNTPWTPTVTVRLDFDTHADQTDAAEFAADVSAKFFSGKLYVEPSSRGMGGYAILDLPILKWSGQGDGPYGNGTYLPSRKKVRAALKALENTLADYGYAHGYDTTIEVQGAENELAYKNGKVVEVVHRAKVGRVPRCPNDADVSALIASRFDYAIIQTIIDTHAAEVEAEAVIEQPATAEPVKSTTKAITINPGSLPTVTSTGDKHTDSLLGCRAAINATIGTAHVGALDEAMFTSLVETAMDVYEASDLHTGPRDNERARRFTRLMTHVIDTNDPDTTGSHGLFATSEDFKKAGTMIRSMLSRKIAREWYDRPEFGAFRKQMKTFDYDAIVNLLAYALIGYAKNERTGRIGEVPASSIVGWLKHFGFKSVDGSTVCFVTAVLSNGLGWIKRTAHHIARVCCAKWATSLKIAAKLPFLKHVVELKPATESVQVKQDEGAEEKKKTGIKLTNPAPSYSSVLHLIDMVTSAPILGHISANPSSPTSKAA